MARVLQSVAPVPPTPRDDQSFLGTGLPAGSIAGVLGASVLVFLFWGGPLWTAPAGTSHVPRILISYLLVIPFAAGLLALAGRRLRAHLASAVGLLWSAKLVITASLYSLLTTGAVSQYDPAVVASTPSTRAPVAALGYRPAAQPGAGATLSGAVRGRGGPIAGAAVYLEAPPSGAPLAGPRDLSLPVGRTEHVDAIVVSTRDRLLAANAGAELHTVRLIRDGQTVSNVPLPSGAHAVELPVPEPGTYAWSCAIHAGEGGTIVVVDHPYAAVTDASGRFTLSAVPEGDVALAVAQGARAAVRRRVHVESPSVEVTIEIEEPE